MSGVGRQVQPQPCGEQMIVAVDRVGLDGVPDLDEGISGALGAQTGLPVWAWAAAWAAA